MGEPLTQRFSKSLQSGGLDVLIKLSFPILLGVAGWTGTTLLDHESRLDVIEASRYTPQEAREDQKEAQTERLALRNLIAQVAQEAAVSRTASHEASKRMDRIEVKLDTILQELRNR